MPSAGIDATSHRAGAGTAGSRSAGSPGTVKRRSGRADQLPSPSRPSRPGAGGIRAEDEAADLEQLPGVLLAIGAEPLRRTGERDGDRLLADRAGDRDTGDAFHALAIDPGEPGGPRIGDSGAKRLHVDGAAGTAALSR